MKKHIFTRNDLYLAVLFVLVVFISIPTRAESLKVLGDEVPIATLAALKAENPYDYKTYRYTGEAVIYYAYIDEDEWECIYYVKDETAAMPIDNFNATFIKEGPIYNIGDKLTGFVVEVEENDDYGLILTNHYEETLGTVVSGGNFAKATTMTIADLNATLTDNYYNLIKINNVTFKNVATGAVFSEEQVELDITDGETDGKMNVLAGTDLIGTPIPTEAVSLVGLSFGKDNAIIAPRSLADIMGPASMDITPESIDRKTAYLNVATELAKLSVKTKNIPTPVLITISGEDAAMFTVSPEEIPAGSQEQAVTVTYKPTKVNVHKASLTFDCPNDETLTKTISLDGVCIDPDNPPIITLDETSLTDFTAEAGTTQEQIIKVMTAHLPERGKVKVMGEGEGAFAINLTSLSKGSTQDLKITFSPPNKGTFTERIEFSALEANTVYLTVTGIGTVVEPPVLTASPEEISFNAVAGEEYTTEEITIIGANTTEEITLSIDPQGESRFRTSVNSLPAAGGSFTVNFQSDEIGVYDARVKVSSNGAEDLYIPVTANNEEGVSISMIPFDRSFNIAVFDLIGKLVISRKECENLEEITKALPTGTYILQISSVTDVQIVKVMVP